MNIFKHEFNMKIKSIIIWSLSLAGFIIFYMAFFPSIASDSAALDSIMNSLPEEMLLALGVGGGMSISTLIGYFTLTIAMIQLAIAIQSTNYGFSILTEEERELTADFLMSKPVSRSKIYFSKLAAAYLSLLIVSIVIGISSFIALELFKGENIYDSKNVFIFILSIPILQLVFLSLGMFISLFFRKIRSVLGLSMGLSIGLYVVNSVRGIVGTDILGYITPFYYFEPRVILKAGEYDIKLLSISIIVIMVSLVGSYLLYNRRDIHSL